MSARLVPLDRDATMISAIAIQRPAILIGRHPECDVRIDFPQISRRHCFIGTAYDRLIIRDLGSRHGVRINGRVVNESILRSGDEIAIGPFLFRLEEVAPPLSPPVAKVVPEPVQYPPPPTPAARFEELDDLIPLDLD